MVLAFVLLRQWGAWQPWELWAHDQLQRHQPDQGPDSRLLIVAITEADIRHQVRWPFVDQVYASALDRLQGAGAAVIGLDIYRDFPVPPGHGALLEQFRRPNVIAIGNLDRQNGTPPPPQIAPSQVGFNDLIFDPDGVVRRQLLVGDNSLGKSELSFSLNLAFTYLAARGIVPQASPESPNYFRLGDQSFLPLQPHSGGYQRIDTAGYQILLRYRTAGPIAPVVTLGDLLAGKVPATAIRGKIVLIGSIAPSLKDDILTPYGDLRNTRKRQAGVWVHGQMISQILDAATGDRPLLRSLPPLGEWVWIALMGILGGAIGLEARNPFKLGLLSMGGIGIGISLPAIALSHSLIVPLAAPLSAWGLVCLGALVQRSYTDYQQQRMVMRLLGQNTSPEIAAALWQQRHSLLEAGQLPGNLITATILFLDIKGFSTIAETMAPDRLLIWLNELLEMITEAVLAHQGIINKFTGDGVMALFGVPLAGQAPQDIARDVQRAVTCAQAIGDRLNAINQRWRDRQLPSIQLRIGIFTGPVVVGSLGGKHRLEYGVIGDSVNTAARLESYQKHRQISDCRILTAEETCQYLDDRFPLEFWGPLKLKGKKQPVKVYRVLPAPGVTTH